VCSPDDQDLKGDNEMNERSILQRVRELVEEERRLREAPPTASAGEPLAKIEQELDQCWDLLRQRRAKGEFGDDPDEASVRDVDTVERYSG
jgi:hypothetical protein